MLETSGRLLRLLSLLQSRPELSGEELAERMGVTTRTVRRDVDRLRSLGYPVDAQPGVGGGYRLGVGATVPPLLLDEDEATAVAIALGASASGATPGLEDPSLAALSKLDRMLPPQVRSRVAAVRSATVRLAGTADDTDASTLVALAQAAAGRERMRLGYRDGAGRVTERRVDPYRLVSTGRRWYLVALDVDRQDWRTFRVDRVVSCAGTGHRFRLDEEPDAAELVSRALSVAPYRYTARVVIEAPASEVRTRVPASVGVVRRRGAGMSLLTTGSDDLDALAGHLIMLGWPFEVLDPPELRERLGELGRELAQRYSAEGGG